MPSICQPTPGMTTSQAPKTNRCRRDAVRGGLDAYTAGRLASRIWNREGGGKKLELWISRTTGGTVFMFPQNSHSGNYGQTTQIDALGTSDFHKIRITERTAFRQPNGGSSGGTAKPKNNKAPIYGALRSNSGGESGIRTLGTVARTTDFESVPFDHSGNSPSRRASYQHSRAGRKPYGSGTPKRWATSS